MYCFWHCFLISENMTLFISFHKIHATNTCKLIYPLYSDHFLTISFFFYQCLCQIKQEFCHKNLPLPVVSHNHWARNRKSITDEIWNPMAIFCQNSLTLHMGFPPRIPNVYQEVKWWSEIIPPLQLGKYLRVIFWEYRESEDTHEKSIFLLFCQNIAMGELVQGKIVQSSNDFFCGQNLRKFEICISWWFSRLEMFKISRFFTKTVGAKKQSYENKTWHKYYFILIL